IYECSESGEVHRRHPAKIRHHLPDTVPAVSAHGGVEHPDSLWPGDRATKIQNNGIAELTLGDSHDPSSFLISLVKNPSLHETTHEPSIEQAAAEQRGIEGESGLAIGVGGQRSRREISIWRYGEGRVVSRYSNAAAVVTGSS